MHHHYTMSEQCNDTAISRETAPQSSPFHQPSPRIPYECLYYVVDYLHDDFHTLKSLLYVNKFFFHAVLPYFIRDPRSIPAMYGKWRDHWTTSEKFLALILTSFLEARLKEFKIPPEAGKLAELGISKIMEHFGLQLVKPFTIPGHQMLRSFFKRIDDKTNAHQNSGGDDLKEIGPEMATDYSKFVAKIPDFCGIPIRVHLMIRLCKLPVEMVAGRIQHPQKVDDKVEEHTISQQLDNRYKTELYDALTKLWNHFNRQHILSYSLDMSLAQNLLSFSKEMAKLQNLRLDRPLDMSNSHLQYTVLFIKQNREAFPRKRLLNIEFGKNWNTHKWSSSSISNVANLEVALAEIKSCRDKTFEHMKSVMAIYEAAGDLLKEIHITNIPYFYERAIEIKADHLMLITDLDEHRIDQGEGPSMEVFLRRCPRVRTLQIGAGSPDMFSWAADEALIANDLEKTGSIKLLNDREQQSQQKPQVRITQRSTKILGSLETLEIFSCRPYRFGIQVVNDVSIAFSTSLQGIRLSVNNNNTNSSVPIVVKRQHIKKSFQLHDVPSANRIGSWPLLLPHLRSIHVILDGVASIQVGSFDQSPNLEALEIRFGSIRIPESRPNDYEELPLPESDEYLNHRWQQARIDSSLFPKWNLPKLKNLILYDSAASRFDFASLCSMENLERLDLGYSEIVFLIGVDEYKRVQSEIWKERLESALDKESGRLNPLDAVKPWMWPLPKLKSLNMDGPPATMFSLDWLLVCPNLESFDLGEPMEPQVIGSVPFFAKGFETLDGKGDNDNGGYKPYMDSRITCVELKAGWRMSSEDLTRLLTIYTPFIDSLCVDRIDDDWDGYSFVKAIKEADSINCGNAMYVRKRQTENRDYVAQAGGTQESNLERPGEDLNRVYSGYSYRKTELRKLNLVKINPREEEKYDDKNLRVYSMLTQVLVDEFDFYAVNNEDGSGDEYDGY